MTALVESAAGGKLVERWIDVALTPAFVFWSGGLICWAYRNGWTELAHRVIGLSGTEQVALAVGAFVVVAASGAAVNRMTLPILRLLEGYFVPPLTPLGWALTSRQNRRLKKLSARFQDLANKNNPTPDEQAECIRLDSRLRRFATEADDTNPVLTLPTRLGNTLRAAESRPQEKYGLEAVTWWPRLWLVMPADARTELTRARARLDDAAALWLWAVLFAVWTGWAWWAAIVAFVVAVAAYTGAVQAAAVYGDLFESAFDIYRTELYAALRWPLPVNPLAEHDQGEALTACIWRGSADPLPIFTTPKDSTPQQTGP